MTWSLFSSLQLKVLNELPLTGVNKRKVKPQNILSLSCLNIVSVRNEMITLVERLQANENLKEIQASKPSLPMLVACTIHIKRTSALLRAPFVINITNMANFAFPRQWQQFQRRLL